MNRLISVILEPLWNFLRASGTVLEGKGLIVATEYYREREGRPRFYSARSTLDPSGRKSSNDNCDNKDAEESSPRARIPISPGDVSATKFNYVKSMDC